MSKPLILVVVGLLIVVFGGFTGYLFLAKDSKTTSPISLVSPGSDKKDVIGKKKVYPDESGFSFEYPEDLKVRDVTPDEEIYYSKAEISNSRGDEKIVISVKDTEGSTIDEWLSDEPQMKMAQVTGATSLGGHSAKQLSLNKGGGKFLVTAMIDSNILYLIEGPKDDGFWEEVQNLISSTFIVGERPEPVFSDASSESVIYEEEEIVE